MPSCSHSLLVAIDLRLGQGATLIVLVVFYTILPTCASILHACFKYMRLQCINLIHRGKINGTPYIYIQHLHSNFFGWTLSFSMAVPIEGSLKVHRFQTLSWQHLVSANLSPQAEKSCQAVSSSRKKVSYPPGGGGVVVERT